MTKINRIKTICSAVFFSAPLISFAQQSKPENISYFSNTLFDALLVAIVCLMILIIAMSNVLKNLTQSDYFFEKLKDKNNPSVTNKTIAIIALLSLLGTQAFSQDDKPLNIIAKNDGLIAGLESFTFYFMLAFIVIEAIVVLILFKLIKGFISLNTKQTEVNTPVQNIKVVPEKTILDKLNASVEVENEEEIMLEHDYDGIRELDNNLPPWWKYGFYLTIVISIIYMINYHVIDTGDLQITEYKKELASAKIQIEEYMKLSASNVDESTVKMLEGTDIADGKTTYISNCVACHGKLGEGSVGPNLTDSYWLHSGGIADIFKSIKYGWTDKGMKSWKEDLSPLQIAQVASFIKTLAGTNPPNGKVAQGEIYTDTKTPSTSDSTKVVAADSLLIKNTTKDSSVVKK